MPFRLFKLSYLEDACVSLLCIEIFLKPFPCGVLILLLFHRFCVYSKSFLKCSPSICLSNNLLERINFVFVVQRSHGSEIRRGLFAFVVLICLNCYVDDTVCVCSPVFA